MPNVTINYEGPDRPLSRDRLPLVGGPSSFLGQISVGDRVVVKPTTNYHDFAGHYGHVIYAENDPEWPIYVQLEGRDGKPVHPEVRENDIWPFFPRELEHAD